MKAPAFDYHRPASEAEALQLLATLRDARPLAGGQSLMPMLHLRYLAPAHLVDLNRIPSLAGVRIEGERVRIGAMTRQAALIADGPLGERCPVLREALENVGHAPTRARGTFGGSLAHLDPASEQPAMAALHDAEMVVRSVRGERRISFAEFAVGYMTTALAQDELLTEIQWPLWPRGHGWCFQEFAMRPGDFAIVGVGALLTLKAGRIERAAIVLAGVDAAPLRLTAAEEALRGAQATQESFVNAAACVEALTPLEDAIASAAYRRQLARVYVRRALTTAAARAKA